MAPGDKLASVSRHGVGAFLGAVIFVLCGCGGGGSSGPVAGPPPPPPTPTPPPAALVVDKPTLQFLGTGASFASTIGVTEPGYAGSFALSTTTCAAIATPDTTTSAQMFTITPVAVGKCSFTVTGDRGAQAIVTVTVTTSTVGGQ